MCILYYINYNRILSRATTLFIICRIGDNIWHGFVLPDKLDGLAGGGKRKRDTDVGMEDFLQLPDDYASRMSEPGKKRVMCCTAPYYYY